MSDAFFTLSKWLWLLFSPAHLILLLLLIAWLLLLLGRRRRGMQLMTLLLLALLLLTWFPVGDALLYPLESRFPANPRLPQQVDGIVVLGGSVMPETSRYWRQLEVNEAAERLGAFIELARRYPDARLLFTGGNASLNPGRSTEASQVGRLFRTAGIGDRVVMENQARNTAENARFAKQRLTPKPGEKWILVTTAYHMPRSIGVFCRQGWSMIPYPVDHYSLPEKLLDPRPQLLANLNKLQAALHEWMGLFAYRLTGRTAALLPGACSG